MGVNCQDLASPLSKLPTSELLVNLAECAAPQLETFLLLFRSDVSYLEPGDGSVDKS